MLIERRVKGRELAIVVVVHILKSAKFLKVLNIAVHFLSESVGKSAESQIGSLTCVSQHRNAVC